MCIAPGSMCLLGLPAGQNLVWAEVGGGPRQALSLVSLGLEQVTGFWSWSSQFLGRRPLAIASPAGLLPGASTFWGCQEGCVGIDVRVPRSAPAASGELIVVLLTGFFHGRKLFFP